MIVFRSGQSPVDTSAFATEHINKFLKITRGFPEAGGCRKTGGDSELSSIQSRLSFSFFQPEDFCTTFYIITYGKCFFCGEIGNIWKYIPIGV